METRVLPFRSAAWPRGPRFMQPPSDEDRMVRKIRALTRVDPRLAARLERVLDEALALLAAAARP